MELKAMDIYHSRYGSMLEFGAIVAGGIFVGMLNLLTHYPNWEIWHEIFFLLATILFLGFMMLAFRWWNMLRMTGLPKKEWLIKDNQT